MWSWGSGGQKNIKKSSRKWDFLPGVARSIPYNFCLMWPQTFSMFLICQTTLGDQKRTKQPWSNVFMGVRGPKKHQKKLPKIGFFHISTTGGPIYIYYIYIYIYIIFLHLHVDMIQTTFNMEQLSKCSMVLISKSWFCFQITMIGLDPRTACEI